MDSVAMHTVARVPFVVVRRSTQERREMRAFELGRGSASTLHDAGRSYQAAVDVLQLGAKPLSAAPRTSSVAPD